jgi:hypothetical protein
MRVPGAVVEAATTAKISEPASPGLGHTRAVKKGNATAADFGPGREVVRLVHRGGWSDTFEAVIDSDPALRVAIKVASSVGREDFVERWIESARRVAATLDHEVIVRVLHARHENEWLVAERAFIEGVDVATALAHVEPPGTSVACAIARALASAAVAAKAAGIVAGHITPSHVLVARDGSVSLLHAGAPIDTGPRDPDRSAAADLETAYAPPERFAAAPLASEADAFGVAAVLFGLLRGAPAIPQGHRLGRILERRGGVAIDPDRPIEGVDPSLEPTLRAALSADPVARPDARALLDRVSPLAGDTSEVAIWARMVLGSAALAR